MLEWHPKRLTLAGLMRSRKRRSLHALTPRTKTNRSKVTNGHELLAGIDGRTALARRYRDIAAQVAADMGGVDRCSEARLSLIRRFAACSVLAEQIEARLASGEQIDVEQLSQLSSTIVRLVARIGIERRARSVVPSLDQYLDAKHRGEDDDVIEAEAAE